MGDESNDRDEAKNDEPEPKKDINLFIDDVDWQNTNGVMGLDRTRWTVLVKRAFCYPWEDQSHGIDSILRICFKKV